MLPQSLEESIPDAGNIEVHPQQSRGIASVNKVMGGMIGKLKETRVDVGGMVLAAAILEGGKSDVSSPAVDVQADVDDPAAVHDMDQRQTSQPYAAEANVPAIDFSVLAQPLTNPPAVTLNRLDERPAQSDFESLGVGRSDSRSRSPHEGNRSGGKSRRKSRKNVKKTTRRNKKNVRKSSKNTKQRRSSLRRRSSRKSRK